MTDMHNMLAHIGTAGQCRPEIREGRRERAPTTRRTSRCGSACYLAVSNSVASLELLRPALMPPRRKASNPSARLINLRFAQPTSSLFSRFRASDWNLTMTGLQNTRSVTYIKRYNEIVKQIVQIAQALTVPDDTLNVRPMSYFYYSVSLGQ